MTATKRDHFAEYLIREAEKAEHSHGERLRRTQPVLPIRRIVSEPEPDRQPEEAWQPS